MRIGRNRMEKRHFKFTYQSPITGKDIYILLDILLVGNKRILNYIKKSLSILDECIKQEDTSGFEKQIMLIANYLGYEAIC